MTDSAMVLWRRRGALLGALVFLVLGACGSDKDGTGASAQRGGGRPGGRKSAAAVPVKVEAVARQDISLSSLKNTALEAERWVDVRSRTSGQVVGIVREEGDRVRKGAVMARLDADAAGLQLAQRQVAYDEAARSFEREDEMYRRNLVSKERFESAKTNRARTRAQLDEAKLRLSYTTVVSPISGVVTARNIEIGNTVTNNQVLFSVADFDPLLARIRIPEKEMGRIVVGQEARVTVESAPGRSFEGRVKMISPVVDPGSGTFKVTIEIPRRDAGVLRPGMFSSVYVIVDTHRDALVIPKKALVLEGEGNQVYVYEKDEETAAGRAVRRRIQTGFEDSERLEVVSGLSEGELVITVGQEGLRPGTGVRLVGEGAPATGVSGEKPGEVGTEGRPKEQADAGAGRMVQMRRMLFGRFPKFKAAYEKRVKADPALKADPQKWEAFLSEMRQKGILPARRGRG